MNANENGDHSLPPTVEKIPDLGSGVGSAAGVGVGVNKVAPVGLLWSALSTLIPQLSQNLESCRSFLPHSLQNIIALPIACEPLSLYQHFAVAAILRCLNSTSTLPAKKLEEAAFVNPLALGV